MGARSNWSLRFVHQNDKNRARLWTTEESKSKEEGREREREREPEDWKLMLSSKNGKKTSVMTTEYLKIASNEQL